MNAPSSSPLRLNLTATPRPPETEGNLFVRLSPRTAWRLASFLFSPPSSNDDNDNNNNIAETSSQEEEVPVIDFLPLEITIGQHSRGAAGSKAEDDVDDDDGTITVYASYNGCAPSTSSPTTFPSRPHYGPKNNDDIIELPLDLHPSLQSVFNSTSGPVVVSVRPLTNVPIGERVTFEPLTISDWEMIEMEAAVLEDGGLLNQITVVSPGQVFPLRFGGHHLGGLESAAWIKVVDDFDVSSSQDSNLDVDDDSEESDASFASDSEFDSSIDSCTEEDDDFRESLDGIRRHRCVRLMAETEVAVIPKPRLRKGDPVESDNSNEDSSNAEPIYCPSPPLRIQPVFSDVANSVGTAEELPSLPEPPLGSVCVHSSTLVQLPGYGQCNEVQYQSDKETGRLPMVVTIRKVSGPHSKYSPLHETSKGGGTTDCDVVVATIHTSNCMHEGHIGMHTLLRYQLGVTPLTDWVSIQIWSESYVMNSINGVRHGSENISIAKASMTALSEKLSLHPWIFPDGHSHVTSPTSDMTHPTCEDSGGNDLDKDDRTLSAPATAMGDAICNPTLLFSSGSVVPFELLHSLGLDWLYPNSPQMFILKLKPMKVTPDDSIDGKQRLPPDSSQLIPIFTLRDLAKLSIVEPKNDALFEMREFSPFVSFSEESTVGFSCAIQSIMQSAREIISRASDDEETPIFFESGSIHKHSIMITGEEGSGKSHLAMTSSSKLFLTDLCATVYLDCKKLQAASSSIQSILEKIQKSFHEAMHKQPSVLVLDDLDAIIPNVESSGADGDGSIHHQQLNPLLVLQTKIIVDHLLLQSQYCCRSTRFNNLTKKAGVTLICTCRDKDSLSIRYQESGIFHSLAEVPSLDSFQRTQFLNNNMFGHTQLSSENGISHAISRLGKDTDGFRPRDLKIVATRIVHLDYLRKFDESPELDICFSESEEARKSSLKNLELDIASIIEDYAPLCQKSVDIDRNLCSMDWASVGGLIQAKQSLHDIIIHPMKFKSVYDNAPMELPTGVLLYGPPGNGKSFIVPLLAKKSKLNLITCRGPELLDRYIGASEAKVRQLFNRATAAAPAMIFFDEFDSLAPQRGSDHTGVTDRVVNQLLTLLDGAERSKNASHIFIVAATSRPDKIDKALLRPGRLEKHIHVGYPESVLEWNSLFSSLLTARDVDEEVHQLQQGGDLFTSFCKDFGYAKDFSAADMKAVLDTAHLLCVHDILDAKNEVAHGPATLGKSHILEAFRRTRPSLLPKERRILQNIYSSFGSNQIEESTPDHPPDRKLKTSFR